MDIPINDLPGKFLNIVGAVDRPSGLPRGRWNPGIIIGDDTPTNVHESTSREPICYGFYPHFSTLASSNTIECYFGSLNPYDETNHIVWDLFNNVSGVTSGAEGVLYSINITKIKAYYTSEAAEIQVGDEIVQKIFDYMGLPVWSAKHYNQLDSFKYSYTTVPEDPEEEPETIKYIVSCITPHDSIEEPDLTPSSYNGSTPPDNWYIQGENNNGDIVDLWHVRKYKFETSNDNQARNFVVGKVIEVGEGWMMIEQFQMAQNRTVVEERVDRITGEPIGDYDPLLYNLIDNDSGGLLDDFLVQDVYEQYTVRRLNTSDTQVVVIPADPDDEESKDTYEIPNPNQILASISLIEYYGDVHLNNVVGDFQIGEMLQQGILTSEIVGFSPSLNACANCSFKNGCIQYDDYIHPANIDYMTPDRLLFKDGNRRVNTIRYLIRYLEEE